PVAPHTTSPPLEIRDAALGFDDRCVVTVPQMTPLPGTITVVTGRTGAGKSTLLRGIAGLHDHLDGGWSTGVLRIAGHDRRRMPPRDSSRLVGVVLQDPLEGFCGERVRDEIGLAMQMRGVERAAVAEVRQVASRLRIDHLLERPVHALSAGEATLVAIAAAVAERPMLLLVDEPLADLDEAARRRVVHALDDLAHRDGVCVVVAEHRAGALSAVADEWWSVDRGELVRQVAP